MLCVYFVYTFLRGKFEDDKLIYLCVAQGFKHYYPKDVVFELGKAIYGLKQAAMVFWRKHLQAMGQIKDRRYKADPCM